MKDNKKIIAEAGEQMVKQLLLTLLLLFTIFMGQKTDVTYATYHTIQQPIKGIYVSASHTNGPRFEQLLSLVDMEQQK